MQPLMNTDGSRTRLLGRIYQCVAPLEPSVPPGMSLHILAVGCLVLPCRRPRRLGGGKGGEGREPREPKDPNKRMKAGLPPTALPGALGDR